MGDPMAEAPEFLAVKRDGTEKQGSRSITHCLKKVERAFEEMVSRDMDHETCRMIQAKSPTDLFGDSQAIRYSKATTVQQAFFRDIDLRLWA
jgi:hypothetical protein